MSSHPHVRKREIFLPHVSRKNFRTFAKHVIKGIRRDRDRTSVSLEINVESFEISFEINVHLKAEIT